MVKNQLANAGDTGSIPVWGRSPGGRNGNPFQYYCLENLHRQRSLAGYSLRGHKESDMTERTYMPASQFVKMRHETVCH